MKIDAEKTLQALLAAKANELGLSPEDFNLIIKGERPITAAGATWLAEAAEGLGVYEEDVLDMYRRREPKFIKAARKKAEREGKTVEEVLDADRAKATSDLVNLDDENPPIGLVNSSGSYPGIGVSDSSCGGSGSGTLDLGMLDDDPNAQTRINNVVLPEPVPPLIGMLLQQLDIEGIGSSGLMDLTRESEDTALGAELLDEISPSPRTLSLRRAKSEVDELTDMIDKKLRRSRNAPTGHYKPPKKWNKLVLFLFLFAGLAFGVFLATVTGLLQL